MSASSRDGGNAPQSKTGDRRVHERQAIAPRLYVILHGSNSDGILNDVSEGGAALDIVGPKPEGEYLLVDFEMSETGQRFEATGRITWQDETGKRVGVQFVDLPEASRSHIRQWLSIKSASSEPSQSAIVQDAEREGLSVSQRVRQAEPQSEREVEPQSERESDRLVQSLLDSFNTPVKEPPERKPKVTFDNIFSARQDFLSHQRLRKWIAVAAAACLAVLLALGVAAHRSPERNEGTVSVSKAGRRPNTESEGAQLKDGENNGSSSNADSSGAGGAGDGGDSGNTAANSRLPAPALLPSLASTLPKGSHPPCVNLGPPSDKIRIYLWTEKDTPGAIITTYTKYLKAVSDIRVVDKAPYDLVLYVNGANVDAQDPEAGFIWSSRVFRPWYCGESLGLLEQTQVNESLHYVQAVNLDQRIQAEMAYLILHALETIRNEHTK